MTIFSCSKACCQGCLCPPTAFIFINASFFCSGGIRCKAFSISRSSGLIGPSEFSVCSNGFSTVELPYGVLMIVSAVTNSSLSNCWMHGFRRVWYRSLEVNPFQNDTTCLPSLVYPTLPNRDVASHSSRTFATYSSVASLPASHGL